MARVLVAVLLLSALAAGCGGADEEAVLPAGCTEGEDAVLRALGGAPDRVALVGGVRLSDCVRDASTAATIQNVGVTLTGAAEALEATATTDPRRALQLGYLLGATQRGATGSSGGIQLELVERVGRSAALSGAPPPVLRAFEEGLAAGEARG